MCSASVAFVNTGSKVASVGLNHHTCARILRFNCIQNCRIYYVASHFRFFHELQMGRHITAAGQTAGFIISRDIFGFFTNYKWGGTSRRLGKKFEIGVPDQRDRFACKINTPDRRVRIEIPQIVACASMGCSSSKQSRAIGGSKAGSKQSPSDSADTVSPESVAISVAEAPAASDAGASTATGAAATPAVAPAPESLLQLARSGDKDALRAALGPTVLLGGLLHAAAEEVPATRVPLE